MSKVASVYFAGQPLRFFGPHHFLVDALVQFARPASRIGPPRGIEIGAPTTADLELSRCVRAGETVHSGGAGSMRAKATINYKKCLDRRGDHCSARFSTPVVGG